MSVSKYINFTKERKDQKKKKTEPSRIQVKVGVDEARLKANNRNRNREAGTTAQKRNQHAQHTSPISLLSLLLLSILLFFRIQTHQLFSLFLSLEVQKNPKHLNRQLDSDIYIYIYTVYDIVYKPSLSVVPKLWICLSPSCKVLCLLLYVF